MKVLIAMGVGLAMVVFTALLITLSYRHIGGFALIALIPAFFVFREYLKYLNKFKGE